jgi:hypothetical protein
LFSSDSVFATEKEKRQMEEKEKKKEEKKRASGISRREFIKDAGIVVGGVAAGALASCTPAPAPAPPATAVPVQPPVPGQIPSTSGGVEPAFEPEKTMLRMINPMGSGAEVSAVDVKNNKIVRIRPLHYDEVYTKEELAPAMWKIEAAARPSSR